VTRTAHFLGNRIDYVLRVAAHEPGRLLDMVSVAGPSRCTSPTPSPRTRTARSRASGVRVDSSRYYRLAPLLMLRKVRSSLGKDLGDLERRLRAEP
jgi:hypothetical protein